PEALIFHPDRLILPPTDSSCPAILHEVEHRINRQQPLDVSEQSNQETPYMLVLVRPGAIATYYRALRALRNLQVDFGYEFVASDWVPDLAQDDKATQPWMMAEAVPPRSEVHKPRESTQMSPQPVIAQGSREGSNAREGGDLAGGSSGLSGSPGNVRTGGG